MESPAFIDDEVIADSEDDMEQDMYPGPANNGGPGSSNPYKASSVSEFSSHLHPAKAISSISAFTAGPSALPDYPARFTSPGGKGKENAADTSITNIFNELAPMPGTIADRAKTRQRTQKSSPRFTSDVIELTSDEDDDELSLKPSKPQSRPKPKPKTKPKPKEPTKTKQVQNVTDASDPPPRPRPRPRPITKRPKVTEEPDSAFAGPFPPTSTPPIPSHGPEIPIATSPPVPPMLHPNWHTRMTTNHAMISELPPSDPPLPSFPTVHSENRVPRIETLPADRPSSPSSLFSESSSTSKSHKRKRVQPDIDAEIDELAPSQDATDNIGLGRAHISMGPPPTFFAGSSSASSPVRSAGGGVNTTPLNQISTKLQIPPGGVVDLTTLPPTLPPIKVKNPRKSKKVETHVDKDPVPRAVVLDEDDQDEDFNPTGDGDNATKKKGKSKVKEKAAKPTKSKTKAKESAVVLPKAQVEVLITTTTKGKGRAKAPAKNKKDSAADKDVFKSREFIEDSDDEIRLVDSAVAAADDDITTPALSNAIVNEAQSNSAVVGGLATSSSSAAPSKDHNRSNAPPSPEVDPQAEMKGDHPQPSRRGNNKRKLIVESDAEEEEGGVVRVNASPSATKKKRKTTDGDKNDQPKKSKGKKVVLSDEEGEDAHDVVDDDDEGTNKEKRTKKTPRKGPRKVIDDEEEFADEKRQSGPEESRDAIKENVTPAAKPIAMTPKPHNASKPTYTPTPSVGGTGASTKPPLYTRYEIAPRRSSLPMSELIRRANSIPGSPFSTPHPSTPALGSSSKIKPLTARSGTAYSPYLKSSRSMLSRIAPLHPNRRTPPPPPPPPPPRKKSKKELELEEKWEEEMVESVGGVEAWAVLGDDERREMRRMKWARELGGWEE